MNEEISDSTTNQGAPIEAVHSILVKPTKEIGDCDVDNESPLLFDNTYGLPDCDFPYQIK